MNRESPGRPGRPTRYVNVDLVRGLYDMGYSFRAISRKTGFGYGTVRRAFHGLFPFGPGEAPERTVSRSREMAAGV